MDKQLDLMTQRPIQRLFARMIVDPLLTTVRIFNNDMGIIAAEMLLARVKNPALPYQITYVRTEPLFRDSMGKLK